jgi:hypothetical protein
MPPLRARWASFVWLTLAVGAAGGCQRSCGGGSTGSTDGASSSASASAAVGVPECDNYIGKLEECIAHVPADRKKALEDSLERTRATWRTLASNPGARPGLPQSCTLALQTARTTMKQFDCAW